MDNTRTSEHSSAAEQRVYTASVGGSNPSARTIVDFFESVDGYENKIELALRTSLVNVLSLFDKTCLEELTKTEKTILGPVLEAKIKRIFGLESGKCLDYVICGQEVDLKFSIKDSWMIPPECVNKLCLIATLNLDNDLAFGIFHAKKRFLNKGRNRDKKRSISKKHYDKIEWIVKGTNNG